MRDPFRDVALASLAYGAIWAAFGQAAVRMHPLGSPAGVFGVAGLTCALAVVAAGLVTWWRRLARADVAVGVPAALSGVVYAAGAWATNRGLLFSGFSLLVLGAISVLVRLGIAARSEQTANLAGEPLPAYEAPGTEGPKLAWWKAPLMGVFYGGLFGLLGGLSGKEAKALPLFLAIGGGFGLVAGTLLAIRDRMRRGHQP